MTLCAILAKRLKVPAGKHYVRCDLEPIHQPITETVVISGHASAEKKTFGKLHAIDIQMRESSDRRRDNDRRSMGGIAPRSFSIGKRSQKTIADATMC